MGIECIVENGKLIKYKNDGPYSVIDIIPYGVTRIAEDAFSSCYNIAELYIPWYVTEIPETNFVDSTGAKLQESGFKILGEKGTEAEACAKKAGVLFEETNVWLGRDKIMSYFGKSESFSIPNGICSTWGKVFECAPHVTNVQIPESLTFIGAEAFSGCKNLQQIVIPKNVKALAREAFCGCKKLTSIVFENGDTAIGDKCFKRCNKELVISSATGGAVEEYAKKNEISFQAL